MLSTTSFQVELLDDNDLAEQLRRLKDAVGSHGLRARRCRTGSGEEILAVWTYGSLNTEELKRILAKANLTAVIAPICLDR